MSDLDEIAKQVRRRRKELGLTQHQLAAQAGVSRALIAELETERLPELGFKKLVRIMHAVGLDLRVTSLNRQRPTFEDLIEEGGAER